MIKKLNNKINIPLNILWSRNFLLVFFVYFFYTFSRKSLSCLSPFLVEEFHFTKKQIGILLSILSLSYGFSKFVNGLTCDFYLKYVYKIFIAGLFFSGVLNLCFYFTNDFKIYVILTILLGLFQGIGWPSCARILVSRFKGKYLGIVWGFCSAANPLGGLLASTFIAIIVYKSSWINGFFVPGIISLIASIIVTPIIINVKGNKGNDIFTLVPDSKKTSFVLFLNLFYKNLLCNKKIWMLSLSYYFIYLIRMTYNDWLIIFLIEQKNCDYLDAINYFCILELGGFIGMIGSGLVSDLYLKSNRISMSFSSYFFLLLSTFILYTININQTIYIYCVSFFIGLFSFSITTLLGLLSTELSDIKLASSANGFIGFFAYVGSSFAGYPVSLVIDSLGWKFLFIMLILSCLLAKILLFLVYRESKI